MPVGPRIIVSGTIGGSRPEAAPPNFDLIIKSLNEQQTIRVDAEHRMLS